MGLGQLHISDVSDGMKAEVIQVAVVIKVAYEVFSTFKWTTNKGDVKIE